MAVTNGFTASISEAVVLDTTFTDYVTGNTIISSYITIATTGSEGEIVYVDPAGNLRYWPYAFLGYNPIAAQSILTSAMVDGHSRTTTATGMAWVGAHNT